MKTILYVTDFYYKAKGRKYYEEDLYITAHLKDHFNILIGHPHQVLSYLDVADALVFRNTGSVIGYQEYFKQFVEEVKEKDIITFNSLDGKADIKGKQYLLDLMDLDYPVIPTIDHLKDLDKLGDPTTFVVKLKNGADSIGMEFLTKEEVLKIDLKGRLIQPYLDFEYEVSFYYLNNSFQYALYAPNKEKRWDLQEYTATDEDLVFADKFVHWNNMERGIVRIDGCRLKDNSLLLVEVEDLNPFLSLDALSEPKKMDFIKNFICALEQL
ncbi:hypothetical protein [Sediminicola luteus]|uniref:ATP-grasp domain-containing protein n=1 Tax=Sediminicola luteus TaxID=319238 RepID=A0ABV2TV49_9FLAO